MLEWGKRRVLCRPACSGSGYCKCGCVLHNDRKLKLAKQQQGDWLLHQLASTAVNGDRHCVLGCVVCAQAADNDAAWRLLQPALTALQAGVHKDILWDEACAPVPNPPPRQRPATPPTAEAPQPAAPATPSSSAAAAAAGAACTNSVFGFPVAGSSALQHVQPAVGPGTGAGVGQVSQAGSEAAAGVSCDLMQASSSDMADGEESCQDRAAAGAAAASVQQPGGQQQQQQEAQCSLQAPSEPAAHRQQAYSEVVQQPAPAAPAAAAAASAGGSSSPPSGRVMAAPGAAAGGQGGPGSPPPPLFFARFCAGWVHASLGTVAVSLLERQKRWQEAVELLRLLLGGNACVGRRGDWWTRLAINLEHLGRTEDALEVSGGAGGLVAVWFGEGVGCGGVGEVVAWTGSCEACHCGRSVYVSSFNEVDTVW